MSIKFEFLPHAGESILVTTDEFTMLIDGGCSHPFRNKFFANREVPVVDIVAVTHIDDDHIRGVQKLFRNEDFIQNIKYVLFNEPDISEAYIGFTPPDNSSIVSAKQGTSLLKLLNEYSHVKHFDKIHITSNTFKEGNIFGKTEIITLSPTQEALKKLSNVWNPNSAVVHAKLYEENNESILELANKPFIPDSSPTNESSLAFLIKHQEKYFLLLGDAHINQICDSLRMLGYSEEKPLKAEFIKLSHHGSKHNINNDFINLTKTNNYVICKKSYNNTHLPDRSTIARIIHLNKINNKQEKTYFWITKDINDNANFTDTIKDEYNFDVIADCHVMAY